MTATLTIANLKGGSAKTTTAAHLAHAYAAGRSVLCVDADPPGSLLRWSDLGEWDDVPVVGMPTTDLHRRLPGIAASYDLTIVDTPPLDAQAGVVYSAIRAANVVVIPVAPSPIEIDRLTPVLDAIEEVAPLVETPPSVKILLTRVVAGANSGPDARAVLADAGLDVLDVTIPRRERYAMAFGKPIQLGPGDPYVIAAEQLDGGMAR